MNATELLQAGYKRFNDNLSNAMCGYQKRFYDQHGATSYFVNVYQYDMREFRSRGYTGDDYTFEVKNQYSLMGFPDIINFSFPCSKMTIDEMEKFCYDFFIKLGCKNYDD